MSYEIEEISDSDQEKLDTCLLALEEGVADAESQPGWEKIGPTIDAIMGAEDVRMQIRRPGLSTTKLNKMGKIALDLRSMYTDIKPFWEFRSNNRRFEDQAGVLGNLSKWWYSNRNIDQRWVEMIDYTLVAATGYMHFFWNVDLQDIDVRAEDPRDVFPVRQYDKASLQNCLGVIVRRERPTSYLRARHPKLRKLITPDRNGSAKEAGFMAKLRTMGESLMGGSSPFWDRMRGADAPPKKRLSTVTPTTDEFIYYFNDKRVNTKKKAVEVGEFEDELDPTTGDPTGNRKPKFPWSYLAEPGEPLYPNGHMIVFTRKAILEDGPNRFINGFPIPICKATLDSWAWTGIGKAPLWDLLPLQRDVDKTLRVIADHNEQVRKPGLIYDKNALPEKIAKNIHTDMAGWKLGHNPTAGQPPALQQIPPLDQSIPAHLEFLLTQMDEVSGAADLKNLMRLGQIPSTETIDKIIDSLTPAVRARSRALEIFVREFATMLAGAFMQFYDLPMRLRILGEDGATHQDWDFDPRSFVPDYIDDDDYTEDGQVHIQAKLRGPHPLYRRVPRFLGMFEFSVAAGSLLDAATTTKKLIYLQFARMGLIDHWTLLEQFNVPNVGAPPATARTITERLAAEAQMGIGIIASTVGRPPTAQASPSMTPTGAISESG